MEGVSSLFRHVRDDIPSTNFNRIGSAPPSKSILAPHLLEEMSRMTPTENLDTSSKFGHSTEFVVKGGSSSPDEGYTRTNRHHHSKRRHNHDSKSTYFASTSSEDYNHHFDRPPKSLEQTQGAMPKTIIDEHDDLFSITADELESSIEILASNHWQVIDDLHPEHEVSKAYQIVRLAVTVLSGTEQYDFINSSISKQYRPSEIVSGTVGAFLFGCFQETYGDVSKACSPLCMTGIHPKGRRSSCEHQIWVQHTPTGVSKFIQIKSDDYDIQDSGKAIVFVTENFTEFTTEEIDAFRKSGVVLAQVMTTKNSKHHQIIRMTPLEKLPIIGQSMPSLNNDSNNDNTVPKESGNSSDSLYKMVTTTPKTVFLIVVVIIVVLLIFAWVLNSRYR